IAITEAAGKADEVGLLKQRRVGGEAVDMHTLRARAGEFKRAHHLGVAIGAGGADDDGQRSVAHGGMIRRNRSRERKRAVGTASIPAAMTRRAIPRRAPSPPFSVVDLRLDRRQRDRSLALAARI